MATPGWTRDYFERGYAQRWGLPAPSDQVRPEANGLCDLLHLPPASRVIDIGCGQGRHAIALAERGLDVIGLDFAVTLPGRARHSRLEAERRSAGFVETWDGCHVDPHAPARPS